MKCPDCGGELRDVIEKYQNPAYRWECKECFLYWSNTELEQDKKWREKVENDDTG